MIPQSLHPSSPQRLFPARSTASLNVCNFLDAGGPIQAGNLSHMILNQIIAAAVGAVLGFGYQRLVGCRTGACPLMRTPWITTIYGALLGLLFASGAR